MSELGETFQLMHDESKKRRASHRENSPELLDAAGIVFTVKNGGAHLVVEGPDGYIDFWPGTGKWIVRKGPKGFGVRKLIAYINGEK